jgi:CubicO group peptidase (beta-lactamase class C family)
VRRVSGLLPGAFLEREVTGPLGIDFTIGLPEKEAGRAAELVQPPVARPANRRRSSASWQPQPSPP